MESLKTDHSIDNTTPELPGRIKSRKVITTVKHRMAVQKVLELIQQRLSDPPALAELARLAGLSRSYFSPIFKEVVGLRLQDYLFLIRIHKAKILLSEISRPVKEVAYEVGFKDPDHFSRTFKKRTGVTPTNWKWMNIEKSHSNDRSKMENRIGETEWTGLPDPATSLE